jgi:myosin-5
VLAAQIFLRAGQMAALDKLRTELLNRSAVTLQRHARGFVLRRRYARARRAALTLQARPPARSLSLAQTCSPYVLLLFRFQACKWKRRPCACREGACTGVLPVHAALLRPAGQALWQAVHCRDDGRGPAQAGARGMAARALVRRMRGVAAAVRLQAAWRRHAARARFLRVRAAALAIQAAFRGLTARSLAADLRRAPAPAPSKRRSASDLAWAASSAPGRKACRPALCTATDRAHALRDEALCRPAPHS